LPDENGFKPVSMQNYCRSTWGKDGSREWGREGSDL
jgi:hypothetical protein